MNLIYVADISSKDRVILEKPKYGIPVKKGIRGRKTTLIKVLNASPVAVEEVIKSVTRWRQIRIRKSTSGFLEIKFTAIRVWRVDKDSHKPLPVWLLIRKELDDSEIKYSFSNAHSLCTWGKLAKMQSERYWIERSFQDAIAIAGMADYRCHCHCRYGRLSGAKLECMAPSHGACSIGNVLGNKRTKAFPQRNAQYYSSRYF